jgi:hypothetical protein
MRTALEPLTPDRTLRAGMPDRTPDRTPFAGTPSLEMRVGTPDGATVPGSLIRRPRSSRMSL